MSVHGTMNARMTVITFAHRGARTEEPENSLPAFRRALELGASGLETDVWLSADREVVCTHDAGWRTPPPPR
jgi:glycerophosphoryl diester phosphodiesterase